MNGIPESQMSEFAPDVIALIGIGAAKVIPLTQGKVAVVDAEDYERLSKHRWYANKGWNTFYASRDVCNNGKKYAVLMHREILELIKGDGKKGDHRNRNGLDNRKTNLREATQAINAHNSKLQRNNTSGYRGVVWHKQRKRWRARIKVNGKFKSCGCYGTAIEAARAFDKAVIQYRDKEAALNFPYERSPHGTTSR